MVRSNLYFLRTPKLGPKSPGTPQESAGPVTEDAQLMRHMDVLSISTNVLHMFSCRRGSNCQHVSHCK